MIFSTHPRGLTNNKKSSNTQASKGPALARACTRAVLEGPKVGLGRSWCTHTGEAVAGRSGEIRRWRSTHGAEAGKGSAWAPQRSLARGPHAARPRRRRQRATAATTQRRRDGEVRRWDSIAQGRALTRVCAHTRTGTRLAWAAAWPRARHGGAWTGVRRFAGYGGAA